MEEDEELTTTGFNDWENLHSHHSSSSPSSTSSHNLSPPHNHNHNHNHNHDLSIFPPVNHEDLPIPHAPLTIYNSDSDNSHPHSPSQLPPPPPPPPRNSRLANWFSFALHLWNSKLISTITHLRSRGVFKSFRSVLATASFLGVLCFWLRRLLRRWHQKRVGDKESVKLLKLMIQERDEKIVQLLEQIALMNKILLARYRIPVLRPS